MVVNYLEIVMVANSPRDLDWERIAEKAKKIFSERKKNVPWKLSEGIRRERRETEQCNAMEIEIEEF